MRKILAVLIIAIFTIIPTKAMEFEPPDIPDTGEIYMPEEELSFTEALWYILSQALEMVTPEIASAVKMGAGLIASVFLLSVVGCFPNVSENALKICSALVIGTILFHPSGTMISMATDVIQDMTHYASVLLPVMGSAMAAQGYIYTSGALCAATSVLTGVLSVLIAKIIVPMLYIFICISFICSVSNETFLLNLQGQIKSLIVWSMKTVLYVFTGYLTITGAVCGTVDSSAVRAAKLTFAQMIPVVGGIISEASESILISAGTMKNSAGIYGILSIIAVFIGPFLKIGVSYIVMKISVAICSVFASKQAGVLLNDFSAAMGMVLGMIGTVCVLLLIGVASFMRGVSP